ncbi:uncharacterized protein LOC123564898 [Mercenaria mercenaria]|uniref:uncharacterized protein LOC123564898 n=1 Tax=Mercenaria mercenaria TaxID=6596 RepID=UPI00234F8BEE|nr:uncharacterized protein LOC123564898 [Mercenaria mercenaria]
MVDVENILSCSICMEIFRVPRVLPCQHTFCEDCLSSYIRDVRKKKGKKKKSATTFKCPLCRTRVDLKEEPFDASTFPLNLTVVAFVDTPSFIETYSGSSEKNTGQTKPESDTTNNVLSISRVLEDGISQNIDEHSFDLLLDTSDGFSRHVVQSILYPIVNYNGFTLRSVQAVIELLTSVVITSYVLWVIKEHNLWLIYLLCLIHFCKGIMVSAWKAGQHMDLRMFFRSAAGHVVLHIFECAFLGFMVFFVLFTASFLESIRTAPVRRFTVMSDLGQPQCIEEKYLDFKFVLNQAMQIMYLTFNKCVYQFHIFKDNWYRLLLN